MQEKIKYVHNCRSHQSKGRNLPNTNSKAISPAEKEISKSVKSMKDFRENKFENSKNYMGKALKTDNNFIINPQKSTSKLKKLQIFITGNVSDGSNQRKYNYSQQKINKQTGLGMANINECVKFDKRKASPLIKSSVLEKLKKNALKLSNLSPIEMESPHRSFEFDKHISKDISKENSKLEKIKDTILQKLSLKIDPIKYNDLTLENDKKFEFLKSSINTFENCKNKVCQEMLLKIEKENENLKNENSRLTYNKELMRKNYDEQIRIVVGKSSFLQLIDEFKAKIKEYQVQILCEEQNCQSYKHKLTKYLENLVHVQTSYEKNVSSIKAKLNLFKNLAKNKNKEIKDLQNQIHNYQNLIEKREC